MDRLQPYELAAYEAYCRAGKPGLSLDTNKRLYGLFLHGLSVEDLLAQNPGLGLGAIIKARVDGRWGARRDSYLGELLGGVQSEVRQLAAESFGFMALQLTVFYKKYGEAMKRYLQTGDEKDFAAARAAIPDNIKEQKTVIEMLTRLVEAGKPPAGKGAGDAPTSPLVSVMAGPGASVTVSDGSSGGRRFTPEEADAIRLSVETDK